MYLRSHTNMTSLSTMFATEMPAWEEAKIFLSLFLQNHVALWLRSTPEGVSELVIYVEGVALPI